MFKNQIPISAKMNEHLRNSLLIAFVTLTLTMQSNAQFAVWDPAALCAIDPNGDCVPNTLLSAVPFLRIVPDAIGGGMGDAGVATPANAYSLNYNASKIAFAKNESEFSASYVPWLRNLGLNDVYLAYIGGYKKIDDIAGFGFDLRFFSLGDINFTDVNGASIGMGRPRELEVGVAYTRKLSPKFAAAVGGSFIYSNLASGFQVGGVDITAGTAFAADISMSYNSNPDLVGPGVNWSWGLAITNLGSKISYTNTESAQAEFIPTNLGLGVGYTRNIDEYNKITFALDLNKLLVPTPYPVTHPDFDTDGDGIGDYRQKSPFAGVFGSFTDAPGGFSEELREFSISIGAEYWYDNQFAVRAGYFYENPKKGDRQYLTIGMGLRYNVFGIDLSYLAPTNAQRSPLDNTLRFSFTFGLSDVSQQN